MKRAGCRFDRWRLLPAWLLNNGVPYARVFTVLLIITQTLDDITISKRRGKGGEGGNSDHLRRDAEALGSISNKITQCVWQSVGRKCGAAGQCRIPEHVERRRFVIVLAAGIRPPL